MAFLIKNGCFRQLSFFFLLKVSETAAVPVLPNEGLSSPSQINAFKNSAVWLHWNYTIDPFIVPRYFHFNKQQWTVKDMQNNLSVIAKKTGLNGKVNVSNSLPNFLNGRVTAFTINNTLMISNLQYNDSLLKLDSAVYLSVGSSPGSFLTHLKPTVSLSVFGAPQYLSAYPRYVEVSENRVFVAVLHFDGNPKPTAEIGWSHLKTRTAMTVRTEYPFIYKATGSLGPVTASYCMRVVTTTVKNSIGKATDRHTFIAVLFNLNDPSLRAGKPNQTCVEARWQRKETGACSITYSVSFKIANGAVFFKETVINKAGIVQCGIPSNVNITMIELTLTSTKRSATFITNVSESPFAPSTIPTTNIGTTRNPKDISTVKTEEVKTSRGCNSTFKDKVRSQDSSKTSIHLGYSIVIVILTSVIIFFSVQNYRNRKGEAITSIKVERNLNTDPKNVATDMHYMELQHREKALESNYATLTSHVYANVTEMRSKVTLMLEAGGGEERVGGDAIFVA